MQNHTKLYADISRFMPSANHFYHGNVAYSAIKEYLSDENILFIARHPQGRVSLHNIAGKIRNSDKSMFFERIYQLRSSLPPRELMLVYLEAIQSRNDVFEFIKFNSEPHKAKIPGQAWGYQQERRIRIIRLSDGISSALENDSIPQFVMYKDMTGQNISFSFIYRVLEAGAGKILGYLIKNKLIANVISADAIIAYVVCHLQPEDAEKVLRGVQEVLPGCLANFRDAFGRNLLWYTMYRKYDIKEWNDPQNKLTDFLLSAGCTPDNKNALGIPWRYFKVNAPVKNSFGLPVKLSYAASQNLGEEVGKWQGCMVPGSKIGLPKIKKYSRPRADEPLYVEVKNQLADRLRETFWNFEFNPESTLPEEWQQHILSCGAGKMPIARRIHEIIRLARKSFHHPDARKPYIPTCSRLENIPFKIDNNELLMQDDVEKVIRIMQTGLLIYHPLVCRYLLTRHPEFSSTLRFLYLKIPTYNLEPALQKAVELDDAAEFARLHNNSSKYAFEVIDAVFRGGKSNIISHLLDESVTFAEQYPPKELTFYAASQLDDENGTILLNALENRYPKIIKESEDCLGSNLLYHTIFNRNIKWYDPECKLVKLLKKSGCNMKALNMFGISCMDVLNILNPSDTAWREEYLKRIK